MTNHDTSKKVNVLDHGHVVLFRSMGDDLAVSQAARVSYDEQWRAGEDEGSDKKLINYLWKKAHTTPFEAVTFTFDIKAPIFVLRQWHRHRTQSYNELSARYRPLPEEFYVPELQHITPQAKSNKQGREAEGFTLEQKERVQNVIKISSQASHEEYRDLLEMGLAKELARMVLPVNTYSHMQATMNLLNLMRFLTLRCDAHAQYEIRVYANAMRDLAREIVPVCIDAWEKNLPAHVHVS